MAKIVNFTHEQGASFKRVLTITDDTTPVAVPIDVTGFIFRGQCRPAFTKPVTMAFIFTIKPQVGPDIGIVEMALTPESTNGLLLKEATSYVYDVEMEDLTGDVKRLFQGTISLSPSATV